MPVSRQTLIALGAVAALAGAALLVRAAEDKSATGAASVAAAARAASGSSRPALTVTVITPQRSDWPQTIAANGSVAAWQELVVGAELPGLRLVELRAQVGDRVKRGELLARLQSDNLSADLAASRASLQEAEATLTEAQANAERARQLQPSGAMSAQQSQQYLTGEATARARVATLKARLAADELRLAQTRILAPDDGVVSARPATLGSVMQPGQELLRLIRQGRLEWRAEVAAPELARLKPGMPVRVTPAGGAAVTGSVRMVAPTVDAATRNGLVYVDLPRPGEARAGMFARGEFDVGRLSALSLPQGAVVLRDGFAYVFQVGADQKVQQLKVSVGRRVGERIEITAGLGAQAQVVAQGAGFLSDGDSVRVVAALPAASAAPTAAR
jgi:RND family efflux transporter MFP subunit